MITADNVKAYLGIAPADTADDAWLGNVVAGVNAWVTRLPVLESLPVGDPWPADVTNGAIMLAGHQYNSRNASQGRAQFDIGGGFTATAYADPEIARMLRLRRHTKPMIVGPG